MGGSVAAVGQQRLPLDELEPVDRRQLGGEQALADGELVPGVSGLFVEDTQLHEDVAEETTGVLLDLHGAREAVRVHDPVAPQQAQHRARGLRIALDEAGAPLIDVDGPGARRRLEDQRPDLLVEGQHLQEFPQIEGLQGALDAHTVYSTSRCGPGWAAVH